MRKKLIYRPNDNFWSIFLFPSILFTLYPGTIQKCQKFLPMEPSQSGSVSFGSTTSLCGTVPSVSTVPQGAVMPLFTQGSSTSLASLDQNADKSFVPRQKLLMMTIEDKKVNTSPIFI
jgi:hypothetical protein